MPVYVNMSLFKIFWENIEHDGVLYKSKRLVL